MHNTTEYMPVTNVTKLKNRYPKCFDVKGNFEGEFSFVTDPSVPPAQHAECKVPVELQEKTEAKHGEMVEQGMITPVLEAAEWVNSRT